MECILWNFSLRRFLSPCVTHFSIHIPRLFPLRIKKCNTVCVFNLGQFHSPLSLHYRAEKRWNGCGRRISVAVFVWMRSIYSAQHSTILHATSQWTEQLHTPFLRLLLEGCENTPPPCINVPHYMTLILKPRCSCQLSLFRQPFWNPWRQYVSLF